MTLPDGYELAQFLKLEVETEPTGLVNLVPNPSGELGAWGWVTPLSASTLGAYGTGPSDNGIPYLGYSRAVAGASYWWTEPIAVTPGRYVSAYLKLASSAPPGYPKHSARVRIEFLDAAEAVVSSSPQTALTLDGPVTVPAIVVPGGVSFARIRIDLYTGAGANPAGINGTNVSLATLATATTAAALAGLGPLEPVSYTDILTDSHEIRINRKGLEVGELVATVLSTALDPATSSAIRPGRRLRLRAITSAETWQIAWAGKIAEANVAYEIKDPAVPAGKRARISIVAHDATTTLANALRPEGVGTIAELPFVLEGAGVPWNVNRSGNQVPAATVVTYNENATALDQVALTRDTALGYAWVDRFGVLNAFDADEIPGAPGTPEGVTIYGEDRYSELDVSFSTRDCINEVVIKSQTGTTAGTTEEVTYGPYLDQASISEWGRYRAEFTVAGLDSAEADALAASILASNATPGVRVNALTLPVLSWGDVATYARLELYEAMNVRNVERGIDADVRISELEHTITPDKWITRLTFTGYASVAQPTVQPPVQSGSRPDVGVLELFAGPTSAIPSGKLLCDGASYATADYPYLFAVIGYTFGGAGDFFNVPNLTDRFPIGSGTKALGTTGGASTRTLVAANLPPHKHNITHSHATRSSATDGGSTLAFRRSDNASVISGAGMVGDYGGNSDDGPGTSTAFSILNPWISVNYVIRAA